MLIYIKSIIFQIIITYHPIKIQIFYKYTKYMLLFCSNENNAASFSLFFTQLSIKRKEELLTNSFLIKIN